MIKLCDADKCTGCAACINICPEDCIEMISSEEGFDHPSINPDKCISCRLCQKVCPVLNPVITDNMASPDIYAAWSLDEETRTSSSSGGIFSEIANYIIEKGGYVYGAVFDSNWNVYHTGTDTKEGLASMRGSKYIQSEIGLLFREIRKKLQNGQLILFSGTPCQVAGLYNFLDEKLKNLLITVDFVCHGVPSPKLFQIYLEKLKKIIPGFEAISFRNTAGWKAKPIVRRNGKWHFLKRSANLYFKLFFVSFTLRESCYQCQFTRIPRISDITLADFWGIGKNIPFNHNTYKGVNLLMINSEKGRNILHEIRNNCFLEERTLGEAKIKNRQITSPAIRPSGRDSVYKDFEALSFEKMEEKYLFPTYPPSVVFLKKIRQTIIDLLKLNRIK
jgi:F420H2 dehydrogenase subunit F